MGTTRVQKIFWHFVYVKQDVLIKYIQKMYYKINISFVYIFSLSELRCHLEVPFTVRELSQPLTLKQSSPRIYQAPQWSRWSNGLTSTEYLKAGQLVTYPSLMNCNSSGLKPHLPVLVAFDDRQRWVCGRKQII